MSTQCTNFASNHLQTTSRRWLCSPRFVSSTRGLKTSEETVLPLESADWFLFSFRDGSRKVYCLLWCLLATSVGRLQHTSTLFLCEYRAAFFGFAKITSEKIIWYFMYMGRGYFALFWGLVVIVTWCSSRGPVFDLYTRSPKTLGFHWQESAVLIWKKINACQKKKVCTCWATLTQDGKIHYALYRAHSVQFNRITSSYYFLAP